MNTFFPLKRKRIRKDTYPWINCQLLVLMRKRDRAKKKSFKSKLEDDYIIYKRLRNGVTSAIRKARIHYFKEKLDKTAGNPIAFWNLMKILLPSKRKEKEIEKLIINENEIRDTKEIANCLNSHFTTAATHLMFMNYSEEESPTLNTPEVPPIETILQPAMEIPHFEFHSIPENDVNLMLKNLKPNKAAGADTIAPKILKIAADSLSPSITSLINCSLISCVLSRPMENSESYPEFQRPEIIRTR